MSLCNGVLLLFLSVCSVQCLFLAHDCLMTNMTTRMDTCPPGSCCSVDPTEPTLVYCKPISELGGPCHAAGETNASCPCKSPLKCVPNLQVPTWTSKYGTCQNVTTL
ncbi:hypothetical protein ACF0H5_007260 [Mactra antiquata]